MTAEIKSKAVKRLVADLCAAHGDNLASITLYGSTAANEETHPRADQNVVVVFRQLTLDDLDRAQNALRAWHDANQPAPVMFTLDELKRAADVFPIEFMQMENARKVLYGVDPFQFVEISDANLRRQTEYELRTKFIQLRRLYVSYARSPEQVSALMIDSFGSFAALFRAVLILYGEDPPVLNADAVHRTVNLLGLDAAPFEWIIEQKIRNAARLNENEVNKMFAAYLTEINRVISAVDQIDDNGGRKS